MSCKGIFLLEYMANSCIDSFRGKRPRQKKRDRLKDFAKKENRGEKLLLPCLLHLFSRKNGSFNFKFPFYFSRAGLRGKSSAWHRISDICFSYIPATEKRSLWDTIFHVLSGKKDIANIIYFLRRSSESGGGGGYAKLDDGMGKNSLGRSEHHFLFWKNFRLEASQGTVYLSTEIKYCRSLRSEGGKKLPPPPPLAFPWKKEKRKLRRVDLSSPLFALSVLATTIFSASFIFPLIGGGHATAIVQQKKKENTMRESGGGGNINFFPEPPVLDYFHSGEPLSSLIGGHFSTSPLQMTHERRSCNNTSRILRESVCCAWYRKFISIRNPPLWNIGPDCFTPAKIGKGVSEKKAKNKETFHFTFRQRGRCVDGEKKKQQPRYEALKPPRLRVQSGKRKSSSLLVFFLAGLWSRKGSGGAVSMSYTSLEKSYLCPDIRRISVLLVVNSYSTRRGNKSMGNKCSPTWHILHTLFFMVVCRPLIQCETRCY